MTNYSHLSYEDRRNIEDGLNENKSINQIAKELCRNHSTILREIDRNKKYSEPSTWNNYKINHPDLDLSCERLKHSPYVCNGCKSRSGCRKIRWTYYARESQKSYEELIKSCRQGVNLTLEEIHTINETITPLVKKSQTTNHLYINHPDILDFSKSSFYRYIKDRIFKFGPLDFPRIVKYKKRKKSSQRRTRKEREILINRKYTDFIEFISNNPDLNIVEMDTVEGLQTESDCFLTLLWRKSKFILIFKLESQTTNEVTRIFETLQTLIPLDIYKSLFRIILTENGHEFFDVSNIECIHSTVEYITHLFFCDPHTSNQKGATNKIYPKLNKIDKIKIGKNLKDLRNRLNLTQQQIADECSISRATFCHYELGMNLISALTLYTICKNHKISMDSFLRQ